MIRRGFMKRPSRAMVAIAFATCNGVARMLPSPMPKNLLSEVLKMGNWSRFDFDISSVGLELEIIPWVCLKVLLCFFSLLFFWFFSVLLSGVRGIL